MRSLLVITLAALGAALVAPALPACAQSPPATAPSHEAMHGHHHMMDGPKAGIPRQAGQDAFAAIAEIVALLDADPATDWSKVDLERLRRHLIDMNEVVLHAAVTQVPVPGGLAMDVRGAGRTEEAIRAMVVPHAQELDRMPELTARTEPIAGGVRLTVTARKPEDARAVARVRGLGFIGLLALGAHHAPHHLAMARGAASGAHGH